MRDDEFTHPDLHEGSGTADARPLNLRQIEVFRAIMMSGSISGAGRLLHVSQPAISRALALMESRLGYLLFERARSRLVPTPEATRLYGEVDQVYSVIQRVNELAVSLGREGSGVLRVISSATFGQWLVPQALTRMRQGAGDRPPHAPAGTVDYRSVTFDELVGFFQTGKADVALSMTAAAHPGLTSRCLGQAPLVCVMPHGHALARHAEIRAPEFTATPWIGYPPGTPLANAMQPYLQHAPVSRPAVEVRSGVTALAFVVQGLGAAIVDPWCLTPEMAKLVTARPVADAPLVEIWATHSNLTPLPLLGRRFLESAEAVLGQTKIQPLSLGGAA